MYLLYCQTWREFGNIKKREREFFLSLFLWCFFVFFYHHHEGKVSSSINFRLHIFITITTAKHQHWHIFIFTFSSTSRKQSISFITFSSSLFSKKSCMKCELASIKIVLKYVKSPICNTKTLLAEVFSTLLETRQFRCKSKYHFLKPLPLHFLINFTNFR